MFSLIANSAAAGTASTVTVAALDTSGANLIVANVGWYNGITADGTISDSKGNTWVPLTKQAGGVSFPMSDQLFYVANAIVGSGHTFTWSGTDTYSSMEVIAVNGAAASPFDVQNGVAAATSMSTIQTGSVTPSEDNELLIAGLAHENNSSGVVSIDSAFTISNSIPQVPGINEGSSLAYQIQTVATARNPLWGVTNSVTFGIAATIATFKAAAVAGGFFSRYYYDHNVGGAS